MKSSPNTARISSAHKSNNLIKDDLLSNLQISVGSDPYPKSIVEFDCDSKPNNEEINIENTLQIEEKLWSSLESIRLLEIQNKITIDLIKQDD